MMTAAEIHAWPMASAANDAARRHAAGRATEADARCLAAWDGKVRRHNGGTAYDSANGLEDEGAGDAITKLLSWLRDKLSPQDIGAAEQPVAAALADTSDAATGIVGDVERLGIASSGRPLMASDTAALARRVAKGRAAQAGEAAKEFATRWPDAARIRNIRVSPAMRTTAANVKDAAWPHFDSAVLHNPDMSHPPIRHSRLWFRVKNEWSGSSELP